MLQSLLIPEAMKIYQQTTHKESDILLKRVKSSYMDKAEKK
jgi:hypothetical protein